MSDLYEILKETAESSPKEAAGMAAIVILVSVGVKAIVDVAKS